MVNIQKITERGIYQDLLREFVKNGHSVTVVSPAERRLGEQTRALYDGSGCKVLRVKTGNLQKTKFVEKSISTLMLEWQFKAAIEKYLSNEKFDLILYSTPPITLYEAIKWAKHRNSAKAYLLLKDIFPQNAVDLGLFSNKGIICKYLRTKEKKLYALSDYIGCMSQANMNFLLRHNPDVPAGKVHILPNCIEPLATVPDDKDKAEVRRIHCIPEQATIYVYGGNLGKSQAIPFLVECLRQNQHKSDRYFIICGKGTDRYILERYIAEERPENVKLMDELPKDDYDKLLCACDVGLIFLDKHFTIPNFPSRLLTYMENKMPIIAATDVNTDLGEVIVNGSFGWWCESRNAGDFTQIIDSVSAESIQQMGNNAYQYLLEHYTVGKGYKDMMLKLGGS